MKPEMRQSDHQELWWTWTISESLDCSSYVNHHRAGLEAFPFTDYHQEIWQELWRALTTSERLHCFAKLNDH